MKHNFYKLVCILSFIIVGTVFPLFAQDQFNKKPLQNLNNDLVEKIDKNVDLTKPFSLVLTGVLTKEGKLDPQKTSYTKIEGDSEMIDIAKKAIGAVNDSGLFSYLADMGVEKMQIDFLQDDKQVLANIKSELISEERTKSVATGFNVLFQVAKIQLEKNSDAQTLLTFLNAIKTTSNGKFLVVDFVIPKEETHRLLQQKLKKTEKQ